MGFHRLLNLGFDHHPLAYAIQWERHHLFMREVGGRMVASVIVALLVGLLFLESASQTDLMIWFGGVAFVSLNSYWIIRYYNRYVGIARPNYLQDSLEVRVQRVKTARRWHLINLYLSIIWGIFWAAPSFLFFPDASVVQVYSLLLLVILMSSMPSVTMGCYPDIYLAFLTPVLGAFSWQLITMDLDGGWIHKVVGPIAWVMLVAYSLAIFKTQIEAIILRLEHQQARKEAAEASEAKTRFMAAASHDLRQPLQAARLYMHALMQGDHASLNEHKALLDRVNLGLLNANDLLDRLLDASRLDAGAVSVNAETFDLSELAYELLDLLQVKADEKQLDLTFQRSETPCVVTTDRLLMARVLRNLLENALLYTHQGEVRLVLGHKLGNRIQIRVCDTGEGIPADKQQTVFEEFTRLSGDHAKAGVGMGLPIVKRLCHLLGVTVELVSQPGRGTEFILELPCASRSFREGAGRFNIVAREPLFDITEDIGLGSELDASLNNRVILAVDDNSTILDAISLALIPEGCDVWVAESVEEALQQITEHGLVLDGLISDDQLDVLHTSDDLIARVQATQPSEVPVVILTGSTDPERLEALRRGHHSVLVKPAAPEQLIKTLRNTFMEG